MADKNDGGDKTEKPTTKKLKDARKKGDVPRSKEVTSVVLLGAWLLLGVLALTPVTERLTVLLQLTLVNVVNPRDHLIEVGSIAFQAFVIITAIVFVPIMLIGILTEYIQIGGIFAVDKFTPKLEKLNPIEGFKRMFTVDNLVEVLKTLAKSVVLVWITWLVLKSMMPDMMKLATATPLGLKSLYWQAGFKLMGWTILVFALVAILDYTYQHHSFTKKMRMSMRDIRREMKDSEGDPYIKQHRKQLHQEWASQNSQSAARQASVLVVNPTHIAVAINYDPESTPVPIITAKGEDLMALSMREAATEAGVPILRNIELARDLHRRVSLESVVPNDLFEIIAEVIVWAKQVKEARQAGKDDVPTGPGAEADDPGTGKPPPKKAPTRSSGFGPANQGPPLLGKP
jgi:type III secretion protein U